MRMQEVAASLMQWVPKAQPLLPPDLINGKGVLFEFYPIVQQSEAHANCEAHMCTSQSITKLIYEAEEIS